MPFFYIQSKSIKVNWFNYHNVINLVKYKKVIKRQAMWTLCGLYLPLMIVNGLSFTASLKWSGAR